MRLRMLVLAAGLLWPVSVNSETIPIAAFLNGNDLFHVCSDGRDVVRQICEAYVEGVADTVMGVTALKANGLERPSTCLPKGIPPEQVKDVVMQYLTAHPATRHQAAASEAWSALQAAFPCK
jgi:hypothetical protein